MGPTHRAVQARASLVGLIALWNCGNVVEAPPAPSQQTPLDTTIGTINASIAPQLGTTRFETRGRVARLLPRNTQASTICVQRTDGRYGCWGRFPQLINGRSYVAEVIPGSHPIISVTTEFGRPCVVDSMGKLWCRGGIPILQYPSSVQQALRFSLVQMPTDGEFHNGCLFREGRATCLFTAPETAMRCHPFSPCAPIPFELAPPGGIFFTSGDCSIEGPRRSAHCWVYPRIVPFEQRTAVDAHNLEIITGGVTGQCGLDQRGKVLCWGTGHRGLRGLGDGPPTVSVWSVTEVPFTRRIISFSGGLSTFCAVDEANELWCWGGGRFWASGLADGQLNRPARMLGDYHFVSVVASSTEVCALDTERSVHCFGEDLGLPEQELGGGDIRSVPPFIVP